MKNIYYQIWVDCIVAIRRNNTDWKWKTMLFMNIAMGFNLMFIKVALGHFLPVVKKYNLDIDFFRGTSLDALLEYLILYGIPIQIVNYYFIFYRKKYEQLISEYPFYDGKYFIVYLFLSLGIPFTAITIIFFRQ